MKVVGIGSPTMLRVRPRRCEIGVLRDVLSETLDLAVRTLGKTSTRGGESDSLACRAHECAGAEAEVAAVAELLEQLRAADEADEPYVLVGPTSVLDPVIRNAAFDAVERHGKAVDVFLGDASGEVTPEQLRDAADAAAACTATLIWLVDALGGRGTPRAIDAA